MNTQYDPILRIIIIFSLLSTVSNRTVISKQNGLLSTLPCTKKPGVSFGDISHRAATGSQYVYFCFFNSSRSSSIPVEAPLAICVMLPFPPA